MLNICLSVSLVGVVSLLLTQSAHTDYQDTLYLLAPNSLYLTTRGLHDLELWRLVTGHFCHISLGHWAGNFAALAASCIIWHGKLTSKLFWTLLLWISLSLSIALILLPPRPEWYAGLSGVIMGLYGFCAVRYWQRVASLETLILLVISAKMAAEQLGWHIERDFPVIYAAHLYGAVIGAITALAIRILRPATKQPL